MGARNAQAQSYADILGREKAVKEMIEMLRLDAGPLSSRVSIGCPAHHAVHQSYRRLAKRATFPKFGQPITRSVEVFLAHIGSTGETHVATAAVTQIERRRSSALAQETKHD